MNINSILNIAHPISVYKKENDKKDTGFMDILAQTAKEAVSVQETEYSVSSEEIQAIAAESGDKVSDSPRYTFTEEEAEYFRKKYGEEYDEDRAGEFLKELADEDIISYPDALNSLCSITICKVEIFGPYGEKVPMGFAEIPSGVNIVEWLKAHQYEIRITGMGNTRPRNLFKKEYEEFRQEYTKEVTTWEDFLQEQIDFYEYLQSRDTIYDPDGNPRPNDGDYSGRISRTEKVAEVMKQLFGQQSAGGDVNE